MPESDFECPSGMTGTISIKPLDPMAPGTTPYIIQTDNPFEILVEWGVDGPSAPYLGGRWHVRLYISPADGVSPKHGLIADDFVPVTAAPSLPRPRRYSKKFPIAAGTPAGVYHMTAVLTYDNGGPQLEMAGFAEIPFIEFYDA